MLICRTYLRGRKVPIAQDNSIIEMDLVILHLGRRRAAEERSRSMGLGINVDENSPSVGLIDKCSTTFPNPRHGMLSASAACPNAKPKLHSGTPLVFFAKRPYEESTHLGVWIRFIAATVCKASYNRSG